MKTTRTVLWIAGPPDCGKTSVAAVLGERHALPVYHFDRHELAHFARADPVRTPALWAAHPDRMTPQQRWLGSTPATMARETMACWSERVPLALKEIAALPGQIVIAEGPGFFPDVIAPLLGDPAQAVWLLPQARFKRASALARGKPGSRHETDDPERATEQLIQRDLLMGVEIARRARARGLALLEVGDATPLPQVIALVTARFRRWLPE